MPPLARLSFLWPFKKLLIFGVKFILFCGCQLSTHSHTHACGKLLCQRWAAVQKTKNDRGEEIEGGTYGERVRAAA